MVTASRLDRNWRGPVTRASSFYVIKKPVGCRVGASRKYRKASRSLPSPLSLLHRNPLHSFSSTLATHVFEEKGMLRRLFDVDRKQQNINRRQFMTFTMGFLEWYSLSCACFLKFCRFTEGYLGVDMALWIELAELNLALEKPRQERLKCTLKIYMICCRDLICLAGLVCFMFLQPHRLLYDGGDYLQRARYIQ